MGRHERPSCKICRRNRVKLYLKGSRCETAKCAIEKRNTPPGHRLGMARKTSEYGLRLREKQKLRFFYGVSEKQIRHYFELASSQAGITGTNLLQLFEKRMDNFIMRSGLASSRKQARIFVKHGHFLVNGKKMNIPSAQLKEGDEITLRSNSEYWSARLKGVADQTIPSWITYDREKSSIRFQAVPERENIDVPIQEHLIVEFYSR